VNLTLLLLIVYSILLIAIGLWIARLVKGAGDFFVAGRKLSAPLIFSTVLAANIGAGTTVNTAALAFRDGISAWWWVGSAAFGSLVLAFVVGPRLWELAERHGFYTMGDFLEWRYGRETRGLVASLIWLGTLSILAAQLIAGAAVLEVVAGIPKWAGALIGGVVMTSYFVAGGLLSSAWVNMVQLVVLFLGFLAAVPLIVSGVGGFDAISTTAEATPGFGDILYSRGPGSGWALLFLLVPAFIISPGLVQKAYGAKDARAVRLGIGAQAVVLMLFALMPVAIGMAARAAHPDLLVPDQVLPFMLVTYLPPLLGALALAAVFSAEVSTCDAILFMLATSLSKDLYKRFIRPNATDRQVLTVARGAAAVGGALGVVLAILLPTVVAALTIFYSLLAVALFVPLMGGLFTPRALSREALAAILTGVLVRLAIEVFYAGQGVGLLDPTLLGVLAAAVAYVTSLGLRPVFR
jgi:solute:Na+ symporter, SSS family